ncbi:MAG: hypothetical protein MRY74_00440 [Neomegalonema sp.]|nr:hypothetical protein [Neomegalonema sp.]
MTELDLNGNPGGRIPPAILSGYNCLEPLRSYLRNRDLGAPVALRDVKLMILGNGQIGKTLLRLRAP